MNIYGWKKRIQEAKQILKNEMVKSRNRISYKKIDDIKNKIQRLRKKIEKIRQEKK
jgi:hypothetical protein